MEEMKVEKSEPQKLETENQEELVRKKREEIEQQLLDLPIVQYAWLSEEDIPFSDHVREICRKECPRYSQWADRIDFELSGDIVKTERRICKGNAAFVEPYTGIIEQIVKILSFLTDLPIDAIYVRCACDVCCMDAAGFSLQFA